MAGRGGVNHCPLFCLCWLESLASHLVQAVRSSSQRSLGKALQYPGILTILNRLGATYGAKWLDYKKSNHICCPSLIFLSIWDQAFCSITNILHAAEIKLLCPSLHLVPRGIVSILMFDCRNLMNKLTLHLIKSATFVINRHSDLLFVIVRVRLYRERKIKHTHTYVYRKGKVSSVLCLFCFVYSNVVGFFCSIEKSWIFHESLTIRVCVKQFFLQKFFLEQILLNVKHKYKN